MNIQPNFIQKCLFTMALLVPSLLYAQVTKECFKDRLQTPAKEVMNVHLTSSDTIPLNNLGTIYALSIDATIEQPREASFVRIVLEDTEGHNYLVAESDWFRNDTTIVRLSEYCEETAQLNGITPLRLKCYLTHATLNLTSIHTSAEQPKRALTNNDRKQLKEEQVQAIVDRINEYNIRHRKLWRAGVTDINRNLFSHCSADTIIDPYISNLKYYNSGVYEMGERGLREEDSPYPPTFDWRSQHNKNWITSVKSQDSINWCATFAAVALTEAMTNLYFNDTINLDLSEVSVAFYMKGTSNLNVILSGAAPTVPLAYIRDHGVIDEETLPFKSDSIAFYPPVRPEGNELVNIGNYSYIPNIPDSIKKSIIIRGPLRSGLRNPVGGSHAMLLVGYGVVVPDSFYIVGLPANVERYVYANETDLIGKTCWFFKDSYYGIYNHGHDGYMYVIFNDYTYMNPTYAIENHVTRLGHTDDEIVVKDADGDGYFSWGIGPKPSHCPSWAPDEPDGDDSDYTKGPMTPYGFIPDIIPDSSPPILISTNQTYSSKKYLHEHCTIQSGAELIVQDEVQCYNGVQIIVKNNATLRIDGGVIKNVHLIVESGGHLIIEDGGEVFCNPSFPFEIPLGAILEISQGYIH